jgi:hypothetical protein
MSHHTVNPVLPILDRYRSFKGIDFDGQAQRIMARIESHTQDGMDPFWTYFFKRRNATEGARLDDQLLLASFVNQIHDLFEARGDALGLEWLDQIENECF